MFPGSWKCLEPLDYVPGTWKCLEPVIKSNQIKFIHSNKHIILHGSLFIQTCCQDGRQSCRPLNRVPSLPSLMVLRLTPRYVALWVENPFSRTSARTTYRLGEANFHTSIEEEGIFSRHVVLISIIVYLSCNTYNIIWFFIHYNNYGLTL